MKEMPEDEFLQYAADRLAEHNRMLIRLTARTTALLHGVLHITQHLPNAASVHASWEAKLPDLVEREMASERLDDSAWREEWQGTTSAIARLLAAAASRDTGA